jgi:hypothetical protein
MSRTTTTPLADQVGAIWRQVEALPPSETKAKLQIKLGHVATHLARQISAKAKEQKR